MNVFFRGQKVVLKNEVQENNQQHFVCHWKSYLIDVLKWSHGEYDIDIKDMNGNCIPEYTELPYLKNMTDAIQFCMDEIDKDVEARLERNRNNAKIIDEFSMYYKEKICPICKSKRIFKFRLDSDWAVGCGDYGPVNDDKYYTEEELKYDSFDKPDIEVFHCLDCNKLW